MFIAMCAFAALSVFLLVICCFLNIDVKRAVVSKEGWKEQSIEADKSCRVLGHRGALLMSVIKENNDRFQELSDQLEDVQLALAFEKERGVNDERAIKYWITEYNTALDELREARGIASVRTYALGKILETPGSDMDWDKPDAISLAVCSLINDLEATKGLLDVATQEITSLATERDELTALLVKSQEEAAELARECEAAIEVLRDTGKQLDSLRIEVGAVAEAVCVSRGLFIPAPSMVTDGTVRGYVAGKGVALLNYDLDAIVLALDDFKKDLKTRMERLRVVENERDNLAAAAIKPTRGPAEDIAPPAKRTTHKRSNKLRAAEIAKNVKRARA